jgi:predicted permease
MRSLRHAPGFTAATVLILALGIAAVVTMFEVYRAVVLDPVRLPEPDRLVAIAREKRDPLVPASLSWPRVQALRAQATAFAGVAAYSNETVSLSDPGTVPRELRALRVSADFFPLLRLAPARGRVFGEKDDVPNGPAVCLLSHETWLRVFGADDVVGRLVRLDGRPTEIVGILPPRLSPPWGDREIFLPRVFDDSQLTPAAVTAGATYLSAVARLRPDRTRAQASEELRGISRQFARDFAGRSDTLNDLEVTPLADAVTANRGPALTLMLGAVIVVLLVACANVVALVSSRLASRTRELAVRQALGATRLTIVRQLLGESLCLAAIAAAIGVGGAALALTVIDARLASVLPPGTALRLSAPALAIAACAVLGVVTITGLLPALQATRAPGDSGATPFARGMSEGARARRLRRALVVAEVALSAFLLVGAVLFITSLRRLLETPVGFDPSNVATGSVTLPAETFRTAEARTAFFVDVVERLQATPHVEAAAVVFGVPFDNDNWVSPYVIAGRPVLPPAERRRAGLRIVSEDYLRVTRARLVAGRFFTAGDRAGAQQVCVLNESLARREFGSRSPLGAVILRGRDADQPFAVVGVIADLRTNGPNAAVPEELFLPFRQVPRPKASLVVRTRDRPDTAATLLRSAVAEVNRDLPLANFTTLEDAMTATIGPQRILAELSGVFAVVALVLAATGLYAVLAHAVAARTVEIGIRMALGADRRSVLGLIVGNALQLVAVGTAGGLAAAAAATRLVAAQLHGIGPRDPLVYVLVAVTFVVIGIASAMAPARRAMRVEPLVALAAR